MADEKDEKVDKTPPQTPSEGKSNNKESSQESKWQDIVEGKFKTPDEVAKAYKDLESKFGKQSDEVKQAREFMTVVEPLLDEIRNDPKLFKELDARLRGDKKKESDKSNENESSNSKANKSKDNADEMRQVASDLLLQKFEEKNEINKLGTEEAKKVRAEIGDAIYELTGKSLKDIDLRRVSSVLDNAYLIVKAKSKSAASSKTDDDRASFSSIPSAGGKSEAVLTPEEAKVAEKLGLTREQYLKGKSPTDKKK